jgi:3D (Asp-Asp-Asp) domain-containing protein
MIRYFYCFCFLAGGMSLPLLAKNAGTANLTPSSSAKGTKNVPSSSTTPAVAQAKEAKEQKHIKPEVTVPSDRSRAMLAEAAASKQQPAVPASAPAKTTTLTKTASSENHAVSKVSQPIAKAKASSTTTSSAKTSTASTAKIESSPSRPRASERLARVTAYWAAEGDYYTERCISATGVRLHDGHCAVDPRIIPYGSVVEIAGVGKFLAVDTGSAVISRTAAREGGHTSAERNAIVVDLFFENRREGERFAACDSKYISISWWTPSSMGTQAKAARDLFAEEDWSKIQGKQL